MLLRACANLAAVGEDYNILLVDRILELEQDCVVGIKNVTANEPFFSGHFPDFPVMPGVLIVEAMGGHGEHVTEPDQIRPALERALASGKPALVNVEMRTDVGQMKGSTYV